MGRRRESDARHRRLLDLAARVLGARLVDHRAAHGAVGGLARVQVTPMQKRRRADRRRYRAEQEAAIEARTAEILAPGFETETDRRLRLAVEALTSRRDAGST